ncbi:hypothetical protein BASA50_007553 [Batrachochytrium salamandrivorans]|uniref:Transforming acidic coiled-coil-containing protein C-terminal domain-containing protein n=1 Tax=Batrachochytrium salamandrivorans TaxID=1357716 RepID=A0ABQ8F730_9FUNG|nr:hypothetical protein BASA50_007553 [Batrachochytrium salamandrivorans]
MGDRIEPLVTICTPLTKLDLRGWNETLSSPRKGAPPSAQPAISAGLMDFRQMAAIPSFRSSSNSSNSYSADGRENCKTDNPHTSLKASSDTVPLPASATPKTSASSWLLGSTWNVFGSSPRPQTSPAQTPIEGFLEKRSMSFSGGGGHSSPMQSQSHTEAAPSSISTLQRSVSSSKLSALAGKQSNLQSLYQTATPSYQPQSSEHKSPSIANEGTSPFIDALRRAQLEGHEPIIVASPSTHRKYTQNTPSQHHRQEQNHVFHRHSVFPSETQVAPLLKSTLDSSNSDGYRLHSSLINSSVSMNRDSFNPEKSIIGGMVYAASNSFGESIDEATVLGDDDLLSSEQAPVEMLDTSYAEDISATVKPALMSLSTSSISSLDSSASLQSPVGTSAQNRYHPLPKTLTPLKQVFSLSDEFASPPKVNLYQLGDSNKVFGERGRSISLGTPPRPESSPTTVGHPLGYPVNATITPADGHNQQYRRTPTASHIAQVSEFDPIGTIPRDWMMQFESPAQLSSRMQNSAHISATPQQSLLDYMAPVLTPASILKYSQRDLDDQCQILKKNFENEFDVAQLEIQELTLTSKNLHLENQQMKDTLTQWEQAVKLMITEKDKEKQQRNIELDALKDELDISRSERDESRKEADQMSLKYKQLRVDIADMKELDERQRETIKELENLVTAANQRFESLRSHAEAKLDEANVEIARVRSVNEKEAAAMRAKLSRVEIQMQTLERNLQTKVQENKELSKICDDLVSQME